MANMKDSERLGLLKEIGMMNASFDLDDEDVQNA